MRTEPDRTAAVGPVGPRSRQSHDDRGMATAELVVVLPAIVLALLVGVGAVSATTMRMRCADAAAVAARLAARGESTQLVVAAARRVAPAGAQVRLDRSSTTVHVTVSMAAQILPVAGLLPHFELTGAFTEPLEPGPPP